MDWWPPHVVQVVGAPEVDHLGAPGQGLEGAEYLRPLADNAYDTVTVFFAGKFGGAICELKVSLGECRDSYLQHNLHPGGNSGPCSPHAQ